VRQAVERAGLDFIDLSGLTDDAVMARVAALPDRTALFESGPIVDADGRVTPAATICAMVSAASRVPMFMSATTDLIGCGTTGGRMRDFGAREKNWTTSWRTFGVKTRAPHRSSSATERCWCNGRFQRVRGA